MNSMTEREIKIRKRAEELWEAAGKPVGQDDEIWHQAEREIEAEENPTRNIPRR